SPPLGNRPAGEQAAGAANRRTAKATGIKGGFADGSFRTVTLGPRHQRRHVHVVPDRLSGCLLEFVEHIANAVAHYDAAESAGAGNSSLDPLDRMRTALAHGSRPDGLERFRIETD